MKRFKYLYITCFVLLGLNFMACKSKDAGGNGQLPTDIVNNPNSAQENVNKENMPVMTFNQDTYDFGEIIQGERVNHEFTFTNTGKTDLIIASARASCGCTVPEYPKQPIKPGESGVIKVSYNSEGRRDAFNKTVTITANTIPNENKIYVKGFVVVPKSK